VCSFFVYSNDVKYKNVRIEKKHKFYTFFFVLLSFSIFLFNIKYNIGTNNNLSANGLLFEEDKILWNSMFFFKTSIEAVGGVIYGFFFFQFIIAGLILFLAMIGAIVLTLENLMKDHRKEDFFFQLIRSRGNYFLN